MAAAGALAERSGALVLTTGPEPPRRWRAGSTLAGLAPRLAGPTCIVASSVSLQSATALATTVFVSVGPAGATGLRFLAGAVVLLAVARPRLSGRSGASWLAIVGFGATMAATSLLLYAAVARIALGSAVTLEFLGPLAVALLAARRRLDAAWAVTATGGVVLLTGGPTATSPTGVAFALGAGAGVAASVLIAGRVSAQTHGTDGLALSVAVAALLTLPVSVPAALDTPDPSTLAVVAAVGVLGIALPYALELAALRRVGIKTYSVLLSLDPAIAGLAGLAFLGQRLSLSELAGIALVIVASAGAVNAR